MPGLLRNGKVVLLVVNVLVWLLIEVIVKGVILFEIHISNSLWFDSCGRESYFVGVS